MLLLLMVAVYKGYVLMKSFAIPIPTEQIADFCQRWKIRELALFGSMLRDDFMPSSDIDLLATFDEDAEWSLLDHVEMQQELEKLLERKVDLLSKRAVEQSSNWIRRNAILHSAQTLIRV